MDEMAGMMGGAEAPDLSALQAQLAALQAESDMNSQGKVKGFLQSGLQDPAAKYNYTEQLGGDVIDYMLESGIDLKKVSMEVAMAKLDEMMAAQEQIVQQLNEYARQHKRELNDAIRQSEDAQDELSAMRQVIQKVATGEQSAETPATDSVDDLGAGAPPMEGEMPPMEGGDMGMPPADMGGMPPAEGGDMGMPPAGGDAGALPPLPPGGAMGMPPAPADTGGAMSPAPMDAGGAGGMPMPPPQQPLPPFAQGGYVDNPRYNKIKSMLSQKRGGTVVSDQNLKQPAVTKPSRAILQGVFGGV
jgi:hypothetical protein